MPRVSPPRLAPLLTFVVLTPAALSLAGCVQDKRTSTAGQFHNVRLSANREPFTFSSWDVDRVEWSAPLKTPDAPPPDVSALLGKDTVLPVRGLTLTKARQTPGLTVGAPAKVDDGQGNVWPTATPAAGGGFRFDFVGDRLVHFVAAPVANPDGSSTAPVFENHAAVDVDADGDVRQYPLPLDHDTCVHLFGTADGLETELALPAVLPG